MAIEQIAAIPTPLENRTKPLASAPNQSRVFSESNDDFRIKSKT